MLAFFKRLRDRLKQLFDDYGYVALSIYWAIFFGSIGLFYLAISRGVDVPALFARVGLDGSELAEKAGTVTVAYAATKVIQPFRILLTLALVPPIGNWWKGRKGAELPDNAAPTSPTEPPSST